MPKPAITSSRGRLDGEALCESCDFRLECTRERARLHVAQHSHVVQYLIRDITTYYPPEKTDD
jgi:hypothetical protein